MNRCKTQNFNDALNSGTDVIVPGYFADEKFLQLGTFMMRVTDSINRSKQQFHYTRFSIQKKLAKTQNCCLQRHNINL
jgi:hypothetical protein